MQINKYKIFVSIFIITILGWSCSTKNNCYTDFHNIPQYGWKISEPVIFNLNDSILNIKDDTDIKVTLRHDNSYPYHDMFISVDFIKNDGETSTELMKCQLADDNGNWLSSGFGAIYEYDITAKKNYNITDLAQIRIWQSMSDSIIIGINEIGITIMNNK